MARAQQWNIGYTVPVAAPFITQIVGTGASGYFADAAGNPRFALLEQCWAIIWNGGKFGGTYQSDIDAYTAARASQGHTVWAGVPWGSTTVDPSSLTFGRSWDGVYPFSINGTPGPIAAGTLTLNNAFWVRVDYMILSALAKNITCFMNLGLSYDFSGFGSTEALSNITSAQEQALGAALAARYPQGTYPNLFFYYGDDETSGTNDTDFANMLTGLTNAGDQRYKVLGMEQYGETNSHIEFDTDAIYVSGGFGVTNATYNWVYTYGPVYKGIEDSYKETVNPIPVIWGDGPYYGDTDNSTPDYTLRRFTWWALASGARGLNNTSGPSTTGLVAHWNGSGVQAALTSDPQGPFVTTTSPAIISYFTGLKDWHKLIPDTGNVFITAGRGTRYTSPSPSFTRNYGNTDNYVAGSITPTGTLAVIYCGQSMSITIDQTKMASGYTATKVDPASLATSSLTPGSTYSTSGNNSAGNPDWAIVLKAP